MSETIPTTVPERDLETVRRWAAVKWPAKFADEVRMEVDVLPRGLDILECRAPWHEDYGPAWTRHPIARFRYVKKDRLWHLYWRDRILKFHVYDAYGFKPSLDVSDLLAEVDEDPTCICSG